MGGNKRGLALLAIALTVSTSALAQEVTREGVIVSRSGQQLHLRTREGPLNVAVSTSTKIRMDKGGLKGTSDGKPQDLIPGLILKAEGTEAGGTLTADKITFKEKDWRTAIATKAGTNEQFAQQQAAIEKNKAGIHELREAMINGQEYQIREEATVYFKTGSAAIAPEYQSKLRTLAGGASKYGNYRISVLGFADTRGNAEANEKLSLKRAMAVSNYVRQSGKIEPGRVLSPSAMGEGTTAPGKSAPAGDDQARRVLVRVVTPKAQLTRE